MDEAIGILTVAKLLKVDVETVYGLVANGDLPRGFSVGASVRWLRSDVDAFLRKRAGERRSKGSFGDSFRHDSAACGAVKVGSIKCLKDCSESMVVRTRLADEMVRFVRSTEAFVHRFETISESSPYFHNHIVVLETIFFSQLLYLCSCVSDFSLKLKDEAVALDELRLGFCDVTSYGFAFDHLRDFINKTYRR